MDRAAAPGWVKVAATMVRRLSARCCPGSQLALGLSETPVQEHPRIHLDLYAGDAAGQAAEVERLVSLGAQRVGWDLYPDDADFVVLADPEGNRFCVIDTGHH
ncbi:VOC family protein [Streptomyces milbemycinicus]|uniref:VOC family protein n=1 Tax=Streptomyces milbemycinicus TaxID=476552 RepID=A0ABW8M3V7_9ACTN